YDGLAEKCWDKPLKGELQRANQLLQVIKGLLLKEALPAPIIGMRLMLMGLRPAALGQTAFAPQILGAQRRGELQQVLSLLQTKFGTDRVFLATDISIPRRERMLQLLAD